jgi:hypothetical protein
VKEQVFDVGHLEAVKLRLKALLISELLTPISEIVHASAPTVRSLDEEGVCLALRFSLSSFLHSLSLPIQLLVMLTIG